MALAYALLTLAFGVLALWGWRRITSDVRRKGRWPSVPGRILERGVGEPMTVMGPGRAYLPRVRYSYEVDGVGQENDQVYLMRGTGNRRDVVEKLVAGLPDPVAVRYDPVDPGDSYLLANPRSTVGILLVFGIVAVVLGLLQLLVAVG